MEQQTPKKNFPKGVSKRLFPKSQDEIALGK
jgi:hypothetical protein